MRVIALAGAVGGLALSVLLVACQRSLIYYPRAYDPGTLARAESAGVVRIGFDTGEGAQAAFYVPPSGRTDAASVPGIIPGSSTARTWLVCGGNGSLALDWLPFVAEARSRFPAHGFLLLDYPGYGLCEGRPGPATIEESIRVAAATLDERSPGHAGPPAPWAVLGHSIGCAAALVAAEALDAREAVLVAPFTSMRDMARRMFGRPFDLLVRHRFDNRERLRQLVPEGIRVALLHGTSDDLIPVEMSRTLRDEFPGAVTLVEVDGAGHNDVVGAAEDRILDAMDVITRTDGDARD